MNKLLYRHIVLDEATTSTSDEATPTGSEEEGRATVKSTKSTLSDEDTVDSQTYYRVNLKQLILCSR